MKQLELIELVQQHHPNMGYKEIRLALNRAQNDYCARTELIKTVYNQMLLKEQGDLEVLLMLEQSSDKE